MQTNKQRKKQVTNKKISQLSQDGIISTNLLFKVKMYSNLVSTIPAALFVSFLGPISDQVPNPTNPYLIIFRWGGRFRWRSPSSATFSSPACSCSMSMPRIGLWKQLSPRFSKIWVWITFYVTTDCYTSDSMWIFSEFTLHSCLIAETHVLWHRCTMIYL